MTHRLVLAFGSLLLLAALGGCSAAGSISMTPVDDSESLAAEASRDLPAEQSTYDRYRFRDIERAIQAGSTTVNATQPTVDPGLPYEHDGRYYNVSTAIVGQESGYSGEVGIDYNTSSVDGTVVAYGELPARDRRALEPLLAPPRKGGEPGTDIDVPVAYTDADANASALVPNQTYDGIRYQGTTYAIDVHVERTTLNTYRYDATLVAESDRTYARTLDREYAFTLSTLSENESAIVEQAVGDTHYIEQTGDPGFASLVDRFRHRRPVTASEYDGAWLVRYDGRRYWTEVRFGQYLPEDEPVIVATRTADGTAG
ncbi:hypothetical protein ACFQL1_01785 [Halomicroarcula sp. GCM10025709]|uniref:hypothetical protein n=1 Tax=Haloarcula TaxID=2237 RepID=UPI0024C2B1F6|nr:hypothetical protein [Halomicroarcula sp. YJ-61-S]